MALICAPVVALVNYRGPGLVKTCCMAIAIIRCGLGMCRVVELVCGTQNYILAGWERFSGIELVCGTMVDIITHIIR